VSLFCLVHGSTQNASGWNLLVPELRKHGHEVVAPELPKNEPDAGATRYAEVIAASIPSAREDVVVVAHSASGLFLPLVPEKRRIRRLVFLAAVIPQIGKSLRDQFNEDKEILNPEWLGKDPTKDRTVADKFLFHDCSPEIRDWAWTTMSLTFARQAMLEVCPLRAWPEAPSSYIVCSQDRTIQPSWARRVARERLGIAALELPGGHCPHVSRPKELAEMLAGLEESAQAAAS
jgi:pimeloyl-ACP methyl ester carboxylesterase